MARKLLLQLTILFIFPLINHCLNLNLAPKPQSQQQIEQHADFRIHQTMATRQNPTPSSSHIDPIYLESMEDLEHVAYLSMRNFNMTDENLLQSSWLMGLGNTLNHKQHQKPVASMALSASDVKDRLALMLESFISHLRNGHLRRLSMEELEAMVEQLRQPVSIISQQDNQELKEASPQMQPLNWDLAFDQVNANKSSVETQTSEQTSEILSDNTAAAGDKFVPSAMDRCQYLVTIYKYELRERQKSAQRITEYESSQVLPLMASDQQRIPSSQSLPEHLDADLPIIIDDNRLMRLCQLAVKCHSAEELVNLISGSWRTMQSASVTNQAGLQTSEPVSPKRKRQSTGSLYSLASGTGQEINKQDIGEERVRAKSLRDSLSLSLAKLCPLILFQLHDDDGLCTVRRDDRPPMITVWGFATLFVTIVSFCSLIGLSITPLLGSTTHQDISGSEESVLDIHLDSPRNRNRYSHSHSHRFATTTGGGNGNGNNTSSRDHNQPANRACLTLFEGLAVGSLVGSALFSLIPQAFELQERESNKGFLLKAFIIFSGIYLFFCSERLMRIILDTRQQRKKKKRLNHRSSNSIPMPSTTGDFDHQQLLHHHHHHHHHHQLHQHQHQQQQQQQQQQQPSGKQNRLYQMLRTNQQQLQDNNQPLNGRKNPANAVTFNARLSPSDRINLSLQQQQPQHLQQRQMLHLRENRRQQSSNVNQHIKIVPPTTSDMVEPIQRVVNFPSTRKQQHRSVCETEAYKSYKGVKTQQQLSSLPKTITHKGNAILHRDGNPSQSKSSSTVVGGRSTSGGYEKTRNNSNNNKNSGSNNNRVRRRKTRHQLLSTKQRQLQRNKKVVHQKHYQQHRRRHQQNYLLPLSAIQQARSNSINMNSDEDEVKFQRQNESQNGTHHYNFQINRRSSSVSSALSSSSSFAERSSDSESESLTSNLHKDNYADSFTNLSNSSLNSNINTNNNNNNYRKDLPLGQSDLNDEDKEEDNDGDEDEEEDEMNYEDRQRDIWLMKQAISQQIKHQTRRHSDSNSNSNNKNSTQLNCIQQEQDHQEQLDFYPCPHRQTSFRLNVDEPETYLRPHLNEANIKQDISTVAWMIVLGDGLHNFIDGISIGAAFSESILSGVSISVAVICEEFPHELGDFAVLVSSGMTVRQALGYNFVSACTCYFGMAVGIILGDVNDGASYISALAAGVFLYIALVDMMGELSATLEKASRDSITQTLKLLLLQNVGIFIGISIIFILSFIDF